MKTMEFFMLIALFLCLVGCGVESKQYVIPGTADGLIGGPMIVDEAINNNLNNGSWHTAFKEFFHIAFAIGAFTFNPVIGGSYLGFSTLYGALAAHHKYKRQEIFWKEKQ